MKRKRFRTKSGKYDKSNGKQLVELDTGENG